MNEHLRRMLAHVVTELAVEGRALSAINTARERESAQRFLRGLDPNSQEALWFEALSESYPTKLDAAIAYVREMKR